MPKRTTVRKPARSRAAVLVVAFGASLALGTGTALAAEDTSQPLIAESVSVTALHDAVRAQAETQARAAAKEKERSEQRAAEAQREAEASRSRAVAWVSPVEGYQVGQSFGKAGAMWASTHSGQDLVVDSGTSVRSVHAGTVVKAGPNGAGDGPAYGNAIVIKHDDATYSQYAHLSRVNVTVGQAVMTGQEIGLSGSTGNSSGPHLHFEIRTTPHYGTAIDPAAFMITRGAGF